MKASDLVALIEAGALDALGPRMGLFMMARTARTVDLPIPDVEWGVIERTSRQRNRLLTVVGENPLATFQATLRAWNVPALSARTAKCCTHQAHPWECCPTRTARASRRSASCPPSPPGRTAAAPWRASRLKAQGRASAA